VAKSRNDLEGVSVSEAEKNEETRKRPLRFALIKDRVCGAVATAIFYSLGVRFFFNVFLGEYWERFTGT
jgi:hypothetical protein